MASFFTLPFLPSCLTLLVLLQIPSYSNAYDYHADCSNLYDCGKIRNIGFPFWGDGRPEGCGHPELFLNCSGSSTFITIKSVKYLVLDADADKRVLRIARFDYMDDLCPEKFIDTILDPQVFEFVPELNHLTLLYGCPSVIPSSVPLGEFYCSENGFQSENGYVLWVNMPGLPGLCNASVVVPIEAPLSLLDVVDIDKVKGAIKDGFEVKWIAGAVECDQCQKSGGVCAYDWDARQTSCYYKGKSSASTIKGYTTPHRPSGTSIR